jgi:queuine tRNA-ribosyltransferase
LRIADFKAIETRFDFRSAGSPIRNPQSAIRNGRYDRRMAALTFKIEKRSGECGARVGRVETPHGGFDTPAFMPVGTKGTVKGLLPSLVKATGAQIILNNTYHLMLRPGSELVERRGGVHKFMRWDGPILTDSGGFQVFSLGDIRKIDDDGVTFRSEVDGKEVRLTPARAMEIQNQLGADIIMAFDDCPPAPTTEEESKVQSLRSKVEEEEEGDPGIRGTSSAGLEELGIRKGGMQRHALSAAEYEERNRVAMARTIQWLDACVKSHGRKADQALFPIVQGGTDLDLRTKCVEAVCQHDQPGFAIGGVAVGEGFEELVRVVRHTAPLLPVEKPRYLMGVGYERDIVEAVRAGIDMFDCVLPTRNGRNANAFTPTGQIRLRNARYAEDDGPIDPACDCVACLGDGSGGFSRSYLRHLFSAEEMLGPILVSLHNLRHFQRLMLDIRATIRDDSWSLLRSRWPVTAG